MSGALNLLISKRTLDAASLTGWSDINLVHPTSTGNNEDCTITWSVGGARNITISPSALSFGTLQYRINSGSWTTYSGAFSLSSGQTLAWRAFSVSSDQSASHTVTDASRGTALDSFNITKTGSP